MSLLHADLDDSVYFDEMPPRAKMAAALTDPRARRTRTLFGRAEASEVLREMMAPWIQELGLTVEACSPAGAALRLPRNARLLRLGNTLSGPALMACADTAMAIAIQGHFGELRNVATVTMAVDFMLPIAAGDVTIAATVRRRGRSLVFTECTFIEPRSRDIAVHATATWAVMPWPLADRG
jgi:uncharacterized protein (TIGR00369 family)